MRRLIQSFSMNNPLLHGIAIGLIIALMFPQASIARQDDSQATSDVMYAVLAATNHQFACTLDTSKKPCGSNALTFTLENGPEPSVGDFEATSNEGHFVNVSISKFLPLIGELDVPEGVTQEEIDTVYQEEFAAFEADFMAAANDELMQIAAEHNLDPGTLELPSLPEFPDTFQEMRASVGIALVTIDGEGGTVFAKALMGRASINGETVTSLLPIEELTFEQLIEQEQTLDQHPDMIGGDTDGPETLESFWRRARCAVTIGLLGASLLFSLSLIAPCLGGVVIACAGSLAASCASIAILASELGTCLATNEFLNNAVSVALAFCAVAIISVPFWG